MGFIKNAKASSIAAEAERARQQGRSVDAPMLTTPMSQHTLSGSVAGWAEMIEAIESKGWSLAEWSVAHDAKGRPQAYPLFRRRTGG
jgi:hypothetical protein